MENKSKSANEITKEVDKIHKEIQPALYESNPGTEALYTETIKEMNLKILTLTVQINVQYPELSKYIEEMPVTVPNKNHPTIHIEDLRRYYSSLDILVSNYIKGHLNKSS